MDISVQFHKIAMMLQRNLSIQTIVKKKLKMYNISIYNCAQILMRGEKTWIRT